MSLEKIGGLIQGLENQDSWQSQRQFRLVLQHWPKAVGFAVARQTRPVGIQRGTLHVATSTATWAQSLAYERLKILRKLNRHQPQRLKGIRFSTAYWDQPNQGQEQRSRQSHHPSAVERSLAFDPMIPQPKTPSEAFQRWAAALQEMQVDQALCPKCRCRCPQGELDRWQVCSLCAAKAW